MKVTRPMIERGIAALSGVEPESEHEMVESVLRAALNDPEEPERPLAGQTNLYDFLHDERV